MRRELSRLSTSLELFIRLPYSRSSKASNPCLPRWRTDSEADRRVGCKAVQMFNTPSMTEHFTFATFSATLSAWGCKTKGSRSARRSQLTRQRQLKCSGRIVFQVTRCSEGGLRLPPKLPTIPQLTWVAKWHFMPPQHLRWPKRQSKFAQDVVSHCIQTNTGRVYVMHLFKHDLRNEQIDHSLGFFALQTHLLWIKIWRYAKVIKVN